MSSWSLQWSLQWPIEPTHLILLLCIVLGLCNSHIHNQNFCILLSTLELSSFMSPSVRNPLLSFLISSIGIQGRRQHTLEERVGGWREEWWGDGGRENECNIIKGCVLQQAILKRSTRIIHVRERDPSTALQSYLSTMSGWKYGRFPFLKS